MPAPPRPTGPISPSGDDDAVGLGGDDDAVGLGGEVVAPGVTLPRTALRFAFVRSSGPGGQNVNKVSTKAELRVRLADLPLPRRTVLRLARLAGTRAIGHEPPPPPAAPAEGAPAAPWAITGELVLAADEHRSQSRNKRACLEKLRELLVAAMHEPKPRRKTRPTRGSVERRLIEKKARGQVKRDRRGEG